MQITNYKQDANNKLQNSKYDLEERTLQFSKKVITFLNTLPKGIVNSTLVSQLSRSSTSIGANYREANDALGKKDFVHRLRIARKEAKETNYWLELIETVNPEEKIKINYLIDECIQLRNILSAIIKKSEF